MNRRRREREEGAILCGTRPVLTELRTRPTRIRRVRIARDVGPEVLDAARQAGVQVVFEDRRRLDALAGGAVHQGVVAEVSPYAYADLEDLIANRPDCILAADQVTDPRNLGALVRSAEAAGLGGVIVPRDRSAGVTEVTSKAAAGAVAHLPIARVTNLSRALEDLKKAGYWVVGLDAGGTRSLFSFAFPSPCVIVVGSEGRGLRHLTRSQCDHLVAIPLAGRVESLNVSVAGAIAFFERLRQRHMIDSPRGR